MAISKSNRRAALSSIDAHFEHNHVEACIKKGAFDVRVYDRRGGEEICFFDSRSLQSESVVGRFSNGSGEIAIPM